MQNVVRINDLISYSVRGRLVQNSVSRDIWYGNWSDLIIGYWSGLDLQVDPYTGGASGTVRVRVLQDVDVAVTHAASFCLGA